MAVTFHQRSAGNNASTTLSSGVTNSDTSFPLTSDTLFLAGGGFVIIDEGLATEELAYYTGKSGGALTIPLANRGLEGGSAQGHATGASVKGVLSADMWNNVIETLANGFSATDGTLDLTKVVSPDGTQTLTNKSITSPTITGTGSAVLSKTSGAITTDTDGATITMDCTTSRHQVVLGGNRTLELSNLSTGQVTIVDLIQDSTGSRTVTWPSFGATATMTIATPCVVTTNKDIPTLTPVIFTTTGALPTGVTASTVYYYVRVNATTGNISTSVANAQAGTYIATSGSQSGTHTCAVQVRWPSQTAPTLSTGKFLTDTINFYCKNATNTVVNATTAIAGV